MVIYRGHHHNLSTWKLITIKAHKVAKKLLVSEYKFYKVKQDLTKYPNCECWWQLELISKRKDGQCTYLVKQCYLCK